jgi:peptidyl-prolyl cis-trans isomerase C
MRSLALTMVLAIALVFSVTGCSKKSKDGSKGDSASVAEAALSGKVVAKVGGKPITMQDVQRQEAMLTQQLQGYADSAQIAGMGATIRKQAVDNAINRILLESALAKMGNKADTKTIDERMDTFRKNFVSDEAYNADLAKRGMTADQFRREIEIGILAEELFNKRTANLKPVSEQDIRAFYDNNEERFVQPERVKASHILLTVNQNDSDTTRAQKKAEAQRILGELKKGADFAEMARKFSDCPSKQQGGDLDFFERGRMVPEFEKAAFGLKTGQMSGVVETQFGYHIIKAVDHAPASTAPFDQAKQNIMQYLTEQQKQQVLTTYFDSLRVASNVQILDSSIVR